MSEEILERLKKAILEYDSEGATQAARIASERGIDPNKILDAMTAGAPADSMTTSAPLPSVSCLTVSILS